MAGIQKDWRGQLTGCQYAFSGINNVIDPSNLDLEAGEVVDAVNVDFDNTNSVNRRFGYSRVTIGDFHSAWENDTKTLAYMVSGSYIYEFDGTDALAIIAVTPDLRMEFIQVNDVVVYSNGVDFGLIGGQFRQTRTYSPEFKVATTGGRNLEFYNGRLYFSKENSLYCTDVFDVEHVDVRFNRVATFPHTVTMCKRVEDGLWLGTEKYVYFLRGDDLQEGGFEQIIKAKSGVVYGTARKTNAEYVPLAKTNNTVVLFLTTAGICSGGDGGSYINHSFNKVTFDTSTKGASTIRTTKGISQYVVTFDVDSGYEYNPYPTTVGTYAQFEMTVPKVTLDATLN